MDTQQHLNNLFRSTFRGRYFNVIFNSSQYADDGSESCDGNKAVSHYFHPF